MVLKEDEWNKAWSVQFKPISGGRLLLKYPDGEERVFDVWDYLKRHNRTKGFWAYLFDQDYFNTVKSIQGMPDWDNGLINISPEILYIESDAVNTFRSSFMSLSMSRITAEGAIPGINLYINENDHPPFHILAVADNNKKANFFLDGTVYNGKLEADDVKLVSDFIKGHKLNILKANKQIRKGAKPKLIRK